MINTNVDDDTTYNRSSLDLMIAVEYIIYLNTFNV